MILYYALGGGLGHLTRGRRVLAALGLEREAMLVTSSAYADDARVSGGLPVVHVPRQLEGDGHAHSLWLRDVIAEARAERVVADTFPGGIQGELCELDVPIDLVARLVRWDVYRAAVRDRLPRLDTTWIVEELTAGEEEYVRANSRQVLPLHLSVPSSNAAAPIEPYWVIVHSGPADEVRELVAYAAELRALGDAPERVLVTSRCAVDLPRGFEAVDAYPAASLFPAASRIISAAGFNVMLETEPWRDKHHVVPFARKFDDQYLRAARRRGALVR